jgi:hypothetical protein
MIQYPKYLEPYFNHLKLRKMKKLLIASSLFVAMAFTTNSAKAQTTIGDFLAAAGNLVNVQVQVTDINLNDVVDIGDITVGDISLVRVDDINISNVLNNNDVRVLSGFLIDIRIDDVLTNVLQNANIITGNQVVIGVLSSGVVLVTDVTNLAAKAKKRK